jgi:hypothetical protein
MCADPLQVLLFLIAGGLVGLIVGLGLGVLIARQPANRKDRP